MPAVKSKKGAVPSTSVSEPYRPARTRPRLAARAPAYGGAADVVTNNSLTAYDDATGKPLFHAGDRADGVPESVSVRPLSNKRTPTTVSNDGGVSMAYGGYAIAGGSLTPLERRRRDMAAARRNVGDLTRVAEAQTMQANEDKAYGALGVATPTSVDVGRDQTINSPLARASIRPEADYLADQYAQEDLYQPEDPEREAASITAARIRAGAQTESARIAAGGRTGAASIAARARLAALRRRGGGVDGEDEEDGGGGGSRSGDSSPGYNSQNPIEDAREARLKRIDRTAKLNAQEAKQRGFVGYSDPYNPKGEPEYMSPAQARLREAADDEKFKREIERTKPGNRGQLFPNFSDPEFVKAAIDDQTLSEDDILQELRSRGFEDIEIRSVLNAIRKGRKKSRSGASPDYGGEGEDLLAPAKGLLSNAF